MSFNTFLPISNALSVFAKWGKKLPGIFVHILKKPQSTEISVIESVKTLNEVVLFLGLSWDDITEKILQWHSKDDPDGTPPGSIFIIRHEKPTIHDHYFFIAGDKLYVHHVEKILSVYLCRVIHLPQEVFGAIKSEEITGYDFKKKHGILVSLRPFSPNFPTSSNFPTHLPYIDKKVNLVNDLDTLGPSHEDNLISFNPVRYHRVWFRINWKPLQPDEGTPPGSVLMYNSSGDLIVKNYMRYVGLISLSEDETYDLSDREVFDWILKVPEDTYFFLIRDKGLTVHHAEKILSVYYRRVIYFDPDPDFGIGTTESEII